LVVALVCLTALQLVNLVRSAQFNENVVSGSLYLLAERLQQDPSQLNEMATRFDARLAILSFDEVKLDDYQKNRLVKNRPLVTSTNFGGSVLLRTLLSESTLLEVEMNSVAEQQAQATAYLLLEDWLRSGKPIEQFLAEVQPHFGYPLSVAPVQQLELSDYDSARLQYGDVLVRIKLDDKEAESIIKIPGTDQAIILGPIRAFNPYSWQAVLVILVIAIMLIGLGVYWVVNSFELRLRKLERATSRLAQGHLSARVSIDGQDAVSRLGEAFNKMAEHIQRLISIQREMVRAVSHELRTPVARLRFGLQIIEDSVEDDYTQKQIKGMDADIEELDELIDEILTYARLEEGGPLLDFQRINIAAIVEQVVDEARPPENVEVVYAGESSEHSLFAEVEPRYIHRAIQNLVGNAGRYANSKVRVTCSVGSDSCRVDIEDDGPGIPKEQWDKVFTAFARLDDSRTRSSGGYGLGLSIVRRIAYWHGGQALVSNSELLGGARFSLIWPRRYNP